MKILTPKTDTISVQDDGIGIPEQELLDIFDPFTVSSKTKTPADGRGVGLALCKKVIDAHNGIISQSALFNRNKPHNPCGNQLSML